MKRLFAATFVGLTIVAMVSTSASAFQRLARSSNGVATRGYGIFFNRASHFAVRRRRVAGASTVISPSVGKALREREVGNFRSAKS